MLMAGASLKSTGKTELICTLIRAFGSRLDIVGMKVTPVSLYGGGVPHGGKPSPLLSARHHTTWLFEEREPTLGTDTSRMLASGAKRAFWLRAREEHLADEFSNLLGIIGEKAVIICESNTLRRFVRPGVFLMILPNDVREIKPSFHDIVELADRIVHTDGSNFDISPNDIHFREGRWSLENSSRIPE